MNYINATDSQLVWWQEVQRYAIFTPSDYIYWRANNKKNCPLFNMVNFYISETSRDSNKFIDFSRGVHLSNFELFGTLNICYSSPENTLNHLQDVFYTLINCVTLYGAGLP